MGEYLIRPAIKELFLKLKSENNWVMVWKKNSMFRNRIQMIRTYIRFKFHFSNKIGKVPNYISGGKKGMAQFQSQLDVYALFYNHTFIKANILHFKINIFNHTYKRKHGRYFQDKSFDAGNAILI